MGLGIRGPEPRASQAPRESFVPYSWATSRQSGMDHCPHPLPSYEMGGECPHYQGEGHGCGSHAWTPMCLALLQELCVY